MEYVLYAKQLVSTDMLTDSEDTNVGGTYLFGVQDDLPPAKAASAVLDAFHSTVTIRTLDDFEILVFDERHNRVDQDPNETAYANKHLAAFMGKVKNGDDPDLAYVKIEVRGGVAEVAENIGHVLVDIVDYDNLEG